jgi:hypothetical protein
MVETSLPVVSANLPLLRPLLHRIAYTFSWFSLQIRSMKSLSTGSTNAKTNQAPDTDPEEPQFEFTTRMEVASVESFFSFELPRSRFDTEENISCTDKSSSSANFADGEESCSSRWDGEICSVDNNS